MIILYLILFLSIILECFPISSSGNIVLFTTWLVQTWNIEFSKNILTYLDYISHGAIAISVCLFFFPRWILFVKKLPTTIPMLIRLCVAGIITESITVLFWILFSAVSISSILPLGFFCTSLLLFSLRFVPIDERKVKTYSLNNAWIFGLVQGIALLPGISRFGSTFVVARWLGFGAQKSFELSFLLGWPINVAAFFLGIYKLSALQLLDLLNLHILLVMLIGSTVALLFFWCVQVIIAKNRLWVFSYYTMVLSFIAWYMRT